MLVCNQLRLRHVIQGSCEPTGSVSDGSIAMCVSSERSCYLASQSSRHLDFTLPSRGEDK